MKDTKQRNVAAEILSLAKVKCEAAEVFGAETDRTLVEFRAGELHSQETKLSHGYGLRVIRNGRIGFAASSNPDRVAEQVAAAAETAEFGREARFELPGPARYPEVKTFDNRVVALTARKMVEWGQELVEAMRSRVPDLKLDLTFTKTYRDVEVRNNRGLEAAYSRATLDMSVTGLLVQDGLIWMSEYASLSDGRQPPIGGLAGRLEERAKWSRSRAKIASGTYPVVLAPMALVNLIGAVEIAVNGKLLEKKTTPLLDRTGQQVLDSGITITDNPLRPFGDASAPADGEGVPRRENVLFDRGVFKGFVFDLATAAACNAATTGSAGRDYTGVPSPGTTNFDVAPGQAKFEETVAGMKEGLLVYECIGGGQSNMLAGDVTLGISSGFKVEGGRVVGRVKDAMFAGNVYEMLRTVEALGDTAQNFGNYLLPFVKLAAVKVATKE